MTDVSIHPRVVNGHTVHEKKNTRKMKNPDVTARKIAAIEGHLDRQPGDAASRSYLLKLTSIKK